MPGRRYPEEDLLPLSPEALDVVERVRAGEHVTFEELPKAVEREIRVFRHRRACVIGEEPLPRVNQRTSCLGFSWPRRHAAVVCDGGFTLGTLGGMQRQVYQDALDVLAPQADHPGMVLMAGPRGTGKTLIATVLAQNLAAASSQPGVVNVAPSASYWTAGDLFAAQRRSFGRARGDIGSEPMEEARSGGLLVIDEIQERGGSDWEQTELTRLMDYRYRMCFPTLMIGNLLPEEIPKCLGPSIISRFQETGALIECNWESYRERRSMALQGRMEVPA